MTPNGYAEKSAEKLEELAAELDNYEIFIRQAAAKGQAFTNLKDIYKKIAEGTKESTSVFEYYSENEPIPASVKIAMARVQRAISNCVNALVLHKA